MRVKINQSELQRLVAEDLNKQGIQPPRKDKWEPHNVQMAISRKLNYPLMWESINRISKQLYDESGKIKSN
jgi:hypothetical protein